MSVTTWFAGPKVTDHFGNPVAENSDFFCSPPSEIGDVISAQSTLDRDHEPRPVTLQRLAATFIAGAITLALWYLISLADWKPEQVPGLRAAGVVAIGIAALLTWLHRKPRYVCSYAGNRGVARFHCYGTRDHVTRQEVFLFSQAENLRSSHRSIRFNLLYVHTEYDYIWTDSLGRRCWRLTGHHHSESGIPANDEDYAFAHAAEQAWCIYMLPKTQAELEAHGAVGFTTVRGAGLQVGPGFLQVDGNRLPLDRTRVTMQRGRLTFRVDAGSLGPFRRRKTHSLACSQILNCRVLLILLDAFFDCEFLESEVAASVRYHALFPAA